MFSKRISTVISYIFAATMAAAPTLLLGATKTVTGESARETVGASTVQVAAQVESRRVSLDTASKTRVALLVELADEPASKVFAREAVTSPEASAYGVAASQVAKIKAAQASLIPALTSSDIKGVQLYSLQRSFNGIALLVSPEKVAKIEKMPGVKAVHRLPTFERNASSSNDFLTIPALWTAAAKNLTGEGVRVGVIDSGIDYVHTNFGGPGTAAAYSAAGASAPNAYYPNAKVVGGYDFVGDDYNANNSDGTEIPVPDNDPLDCNGHGSGCASIIGGLGVNADGTTYTGPYDGTLNDSTLAIAPGIAPKCKLYALRVFGCAGSTNVVYEAIEWALDPNGDGNMNDRLDVINMSLGSAYTPQTGVEYHDITSNAALLGMVVACSAGNESDSYFVTGGPGTGTRVISTAATLNSDFTYPRLITNTQLTPTGNPVIPAGTFYFGSTASFAPEPTLAGTTGKVVVADPLIGNSGPALATNVPGAPLNNAAAISGNIALIRRGTYSFVAKVTNAQRAGAIACIIENNAEGTIPMGGSPVPETITIPVMMISASQGLAIRQTIAAGTEVNVSMIADVNGADIIADYSSRGPRMDDGALKPDIAGPAERVNIALSNTGTGVSTFNGTSSAAPHIAGISALLKQKYPNWKTEEIKAALMNTAAHDLTLTVTNNTNIGVGRAGSGRVDPNNASKTKVVAYGMDRPGMVSVSFGQVDVGTNYTPMYQTIKVQNKSNKALTYNLSYQSSVSLYGGAWFTFPLGNQVSLRAGPDIKVVVVGLEADATQLANLSDDSISFFQSAVIGSSSYSLGRQWLPELAGYLVLTPTDASEPTLRVPLHAAVRAASAMSADFSGVNIGGVDGTFNIPLTGQGFEPSNYGNLPFEQIALAKPFELQAVSQNDDVDGDGNLGDGTLDGLDIKAVGVATDYVTFGATTYDVVNFGIATYGSRSVTSQQVYSFQVAIDVDLDGGEDYYLLTYGLNSSAPDPTNVYITYLYNVAAGTLTFEDYINTVDPTSFSTNYYNNSVISMPVYLADLSFPTASTRFNYYVIGVWFDESIIDGTDWLTYDPAAPGFSTDLGDGGYYAVDVAGSSIDTVYSAANFAANHSLGLSVFHFNNTLGSRVQNLMVTPPQPLVLFMSSTKGGEGDTILITGQNLSGVTKVLFAPDRPAAFRVINDSTIEVTVPRRARTGSITLETAYGSASTGRLKFKITR
ncbi:MAG: S8 family serine peptidase [Verrucomicrobiota bacterium]|nr:S8 family serine peptidase [Verrucomicrobiota bacterium]